MREDDEVNSYARRSTIRRCRDTDGQVIDYGNRWGGGSPPEDGYSVETHPERFAPLPVAEASSRTCVTPSTSESTRAGHGGGSASPRI